MEKVEFHIELNQTQQNERNRLIEQLKQDSFVLSFLKENDLPLDVIEKRTYTLKDFAQSMRKCDACKGLASCTQESEGYQYTLSYDQDSELLMESYRSCSYKKQACALVEHRQKFTYSDMSDAQFLLRFDAIDFTQERDNYVVLVNSLRKISDIHEKGYYLSGDVGTGKTYLACCFINQFALKGVKVAFVHVPSFFVELKNRMQDKEGNAKMLTALRQANVLVLDDIGRENVSSWSRDEILLPLLNERMEKQQLTFFTSNFSMKQLEEVYQNGSRKAGDVMGAKCILERIRVLANEKRLTGASRRK